jgi:hypothetical protein
VTSSDTTPPSNEARKREREDRRDKLLEVIGPYAVIGAGTGVGAGFWAIHVRGVLENESSVLLAMAGGDVALLAIILAAVALMSSFLRGNYGRVIQSVVGLDLFFLPFKLIVWVSALGALVGFAGGADAKSGSTAFRSALFGAGVWFTAWTILGTVMLTYAFIQYSVEDEAVKKEEKEETP